MEEKIQISLLLDVYGKLLTDTQAEIMNDFYNLDNSLTEIAENRKIARQSVKDSITRAKELLLTFEQKLGILAQKNKIVGCIDEALGLATTSEQKAKLVQVKSILEEN